MKKETVRAEFDALLKEKKTQKEAIGILAKNYNTKRGSVSVCLNGHSKYKVRKRSKNSLVPYLSVIDKAVKESSNWNEVHEKLKNVIPFEYTASNLNRSYIHAGYKTNFSKGGVNNQGYWKEEYNSIILEEVSKNPGNLRESFKISTEKINKLSDKKYSWSSIECRWYKYLNHKQEVFKIVSKHQTLTNIKNKTPYSKIRGVRKVIKTIKAKFKSIFS